MKLFNSEFGKRNSELSKVTLRVRSLAGTPVGIGTVSCAFWLRDLCVDAVGSELLLTERCRAQGTVLSAIRKDASPHRCYLPNTGGQFSVPHGRSYRICLLSSAVLDFLRSAIGTESHPRLSADRRPFTAERYL